MIGKNKYGPQEKFLMNNKSVGLTVLDFWEYAYSDLNSDPRDDIAEFLVSNALGIKESTNRQSWTLYDVDYKGVRIEVKSTGYYQTWREEGDVSSHRGFSIRKSTDVKTSIKERHNDIYVFCLLNGVTREEANPLVLENWDFYVIPTSVINSKCGENDSISLNRIKKLGYEKVTYNKLREEILQYAGLICMKNALNKLNKKQIYFICKECSIDKMLLENMSERDLYDIVYEKMCDIEIEEVCANSTGKDTERCKMASDIVTILGNALAEGNGFGDED